MYTDIWERHIKYRSILLGHWYLREEGKRKGKGAIVLKIIHASILSDYSLPPLSGAQVILEWWVYILKNSSRWFWNTSFPPVLYPWLRATSPGFLSSDSALGQKAAHSVRLAHLSMEMPSQRHDVAVMSLALETDNIRESLRIFLTLLQSLRCGHYLLCDQM